MRDQMPINSYPDEVARKWKAESDRFRIALERITQSPQWGQESKSGEMISVTYVLSTIKIAEEALDHKENT